VIEEDAYSDKTNNENKAADLFADRESFDAFDTLKSPKEMRLLRRNILGITMT
jgi:hypothetical protein